MIKNEIIRYLQSVQNSKTSPYVTFDELLKQISTTDFMLLNAALQSLQEEGRVTSSNKGWRIKGKSYAAKKPKADRPKLDNYNTPQSLVWELLKKESFKNILEPACGENSIVNAINAIEKVVNITYSDISTGKDFFSYDTWNGDILTNPPFFLWDRFVKHALGIASNDSKICLLGRVNYFGTHDRNRKGIWKHLKKVYIFDRMIDYRTPYRDDGHFHVGAMVTGWFIWDKTFEGDWSGDTISVQKYATLGAYKPELYTT